MKRAVVLFAILFMELCLVRDVRATTWPGPDALGYSGVTTAYSVTDISGSGIAVSLTDDEVSGAVPIGFPFNFYGSDYTSVYISSNGFITFTPGLNNGCCEGQDIPAVAGPNNLIAGYWTDLDPSSGGTIYYKTTGAPDSRFIVQFMNVPLIGGTTTATFQIMLHEGTNNIEMQFPDSSTNGQQVYVTGIENSTGTAGLQYNYGDYSLTGVGILISPPVITIAPQPVSQTVCAGSSVTFSAAASSTSIPSVQWQVSTDGGSVWNDIPGATSTDLTFTANSSQNGHQYRAVFSSGSRATSTAATLTVTSLTVNTPTIPVGTPGVVYPATQLSNAGGIGAVTYAITSGLLPAGMSLSPAGLLSGIPAQTGSFPITITATDSGGCSGTRNITVSIGCTVMTVAPSAVQGGMVGNVYPATQFSNTGGIAAVTYAITSGLLPAGMSLSPAGLLSGIPAQTGSFPITITATDSNGCAGSSGYTLSIGINSTVTVPAANGKGNITLTTDSPGCWFSDVVTRTEVQVGSDTAFDYPFGLVEFTANCARADVTITFPGSIAGSAYRKFGPMTPGNAGTAAWYTFSNATVGGNSVVLHLVDGQPGDDTGVDGIITDVGGPAQPLAAPAVTVPTMTEWGMILFALLAGAGSLYHIGRRLDSAAKARGSRV